MGIERTRAYWLGLHKIAEEEFVSGSDQIVRVDSEASDDPEVNGWFDGIGGDTLEYVDDGDRGNVLRLAGDGFFGRGVFGIGDDSGNNNPNDVPLSTPNGVLQFWFKNDYTSEDEVIFGVTAENSSDDPIVVRLYTAAGTDTATYNEFDIYLGTDLNDGAWHFVEIDLRARIDALDDDPAYVIDEVNALMVLAEDARIDDLVLSSSKLRAAYQVVPGAQIHAVLGAQSGDEGGACSGVTAEYSRWWYHYNDLGAVLATTKADGSSVGVYIPDFYGNYRTVASGGRPDAMGLTGKFFDSAADLYFFNARWYDPERGRWMSEDPIRQRGGINLYQVNGSNPYTNTDVDGMSWTATIHLPCGPEHIIDTRRRDNWLLIEAKLRGGLCFCDFESNSEHEEVKMLQRCHFIIVTYAGCGLIESETRSSTVRVTPWTPVPASTVYYTTPWTKRIAVPVPSGGNPHCPTICWSNRP